MGGWERLGEEWDRELQGPPEGCRSHVRSADVGNNRTAVLKKASESTVEGGALIEK